jgi:hypothetical protein
MAKKTAEDAADLKTGEGIEQGEPPDEVPAGTDINPETGLAYTSNITAAQAAANAELEDQQMNPETPQTMKVSQLRDLLKAEDTDESRARLAGLADANDDELVSVKA